MSRGKGKAKAAIQRAETKIAAVENKLASMGPRSQRPRGRGRRSARRRPTFNRSIPASNAQAIRPTRPARIANKGNAKAVISGKEFVSPVTVSSSQLVGDILVNLPINPQNLVGTRLQQLSVLWERWRIKKWTLKYIPVAATTVPGQVIMAYDPDVVDNWGNNGLNVQKLTELNGVSVPVYGKTASVSFLPEKQMQNLYGNSSIDPRFSSPGRFILAAATLFTTAMTVGNLYLDYSIEFYKPTLEGITGNVMTGGLSIAGSNANFWGVANFAITQLAGNTAIYQWLSATSFQINNLVQGLNYQAIFYINFSVAGANTITITQTNSQNASANIGVGSQSGSATTACAVLINFQATSNTVAFNIAGTVPAATQMTTIFNLFAVPWANNVMFKELNDKEKMIKMLSMFSNMEKELSFLKAHAPVTQEYNSDIEDAPSPPPPRRAAVQIRSQDPAKSNPGGALASRN